MNFNIEASEFNKIKGITNEINKELKNAVTLAVNDLTLGMEGTSKTKAPVDTGNLRNSIKKLPVKESGNTVSSGVVSEADYSIYVEFGTGDRGASNQVVYPEDGKVTYTKGWGGQKPQPYMRPAFEVTKKNISNIMNKRLGGIK